MIMIYGDVQDPGILCFLWLISLSPLCSLWPLWFVYLEVQRRKRAAGAKFVGKPHLLQLEDCANSNPIQLIHACDARSLAHRLRS